MTINESGYFIFIAEFNRLSNKLTHANNSRNFFILLMELSLAPGSN